MLLLEVVDNCFNEVAVPTFCYVKDDSLPVSSYTLSLTVTGHSVANSRAVLPLGACSKT